MKIHPVGAVLFHVDGHTDMTKLTVAKAPKTVHFAHPVHLRIFCASRNVQHLHPYIKAGYLSQCSYLETSYSSENYDSISDSGR